jgi:phage terminase small subunit
MEQKKEREKNSNTGRRKKTRDYFTHDGHVLTALEAKFIDLYVEHGNQRQAVIGAGYKTKAPGQYAQTLLNKSYITDEIAWRLKRLEEASIANAVEIRQYLTRVMRGEEKDQFGLETPISERTKAAQELSKLQTLDKHLNAANDKSEPIKIVLDWSAVVNKEGDVVEVKNEQ